MIDKLAIIAEWLDAQRMYASANIVDDVLKRVAQSSFMEPDVEEEEPETDIWRPEAYHQLPVVHSASPEFLELLKHNNPAFYEQWIERLKMHGHSPNGVANENHSLTNYMGGHPIRLPSGFSKMPIKDLANFVYPEDVLRRNEEETYKRYQGLTRNQKHRGMFEGNYVSSTQPKEDPTPEELAKLKKPKDYAFDPRAFDLIKQDYAGKGTDPSTMKMPMFDPKMLKQIIDPTDTSEESMALKAKLEGKPMGTQLGYALRNLNPEQMFGMWRKLREKDEETGKKKPFFYPKLK